MSSTEHRFKNQFGVGAMLDQAFSVFASNFGTILGISLCASISVVVGSLFFDIVAMLLAIFVYVFLIAGLSRLIVFHFAGHKMNFMQMIAGAWLSLSGPVAGTGIIFFVFLSIGFSLFVIPGLIILVIWWVAIPVAEIERHPIARNFRRSFELTKGHRLQIIVLCIISLISFSIPFVAVDVTSIVLQGSGIFGVLAVVCVLLLLDAIVTGFSACLVVVSYMGLRAEKEETTAKKIASTS